MQRFNLSLLSLCCLSFTATGNEWKFDDALAVHEERLEECTHILKHNQEPFPTTSWFSSLTTKQQKQVIGYIAFFNDEQCSKDTREKALELTDHITEKSERNNMRELLSEYPIEYLIEDIDKARVMEVRAMYKEPYLPLGVIEELGLE
ncbi:hypothetical protein N9R79_10710 [Vibrio sp.]|nr:hypothetical protein [Vibrio sp.]